MGKPSWINTYQIKGNTLILRGYGAKRTARGKFNGDILTIYDRGEPKGSVTLLKTWPKALAR